MCSHSQLSSRIALIIGAWMPGLETPQQFHHQDSLCETFSKTWKRINQPRISQEVLLFLSTNPNFWVRKYGAVSLVNETPWAEGGWGTHACCRYLYLESPTLTECVLLVCHICIRLQSQIRGTWIWIYSNLDIKGQWSKLETFACSLIS